MNDSRNNRRSRNRNRHSGGPNNPRPAGQEQNRRQNQAPTQTAAGAAQASGNNRRRNQNKNRRPKSLSPIRILQKYENLMEQHIIARRKFFEGHGRLQGKQLEKVEQNFTRTLHDMRNFELSLKDWQKEVLESKTNCYPEDRYYSTVNSLPAEGEKVPFAGDFEDPHYLPTQAAANYAEDREESVGSMDDYFKYKGIDPVTKA